MYFVYTVARCLRRNVFDCVASSLHMRKRIWKELANRSLVSSRRYCNNHLGDLYRNESVQRYLRQLVEEYRDVTKTLQHGFLNDPARKELNKRQVGLSPVATAFQSAEHAVKDLEEVETLLQSKLCSVLCILLIAN